MKSHSSIAGWLLLVLAAAPAATGCLVPGVRSSNGEPGGLGGVSGKLSVGGSGAVGPVGGRGSATAPESGGTSEMALGGSGGHRNESGSGPGRAGSGGAGSAAGGAGAAGGNAIAGGGGASSAGPGGTGGIGGQAGAWPGTGGGPAVPGSGGSSGSGGCLAPGHPLVQGLHGCVEDLGGGRVRLTYEFERAAELLDWEFHQDPAVVLTVNGRGELAVPTLEAYALGLVRLKQALRVDSVSYEARLEGGDHINLYIDARLDGDSWAPSPGLACIHNGAGQLIMVDGVESPNRPITPTQTDVTYSGSISVTDTQLTWTLGGETYSSQFDERARPTNREFAMGSWTSRVHFGRIAIEGELDTP